MNAFDAISDIGSSLSSGVKAVGITPPQGRLHLFNQFLIKNLLLSEKNLFSKIYIDCFYNWSKNVEKLLDYILEHDGVEIMTGKQIYNWYTDQVLF